MCRRRYDLFPQLFQFNDFGLLLLRLMVAAVFISSGSSNLKDPSGRSKGISMSKGFTVFLGAAEVAGGLGVALGAFTQLAAIGLILIMMGAIQKKIFVWHTGFWGEKNSGAHYDLMLLIMNLVIVFTNGGRFTLDRYLHLIH
ncbi:MAG: DoxX family protein [Terriglobales bacterium]